MSSTSTKQTAKLLLVEASRLSLKTAQDKLINEVQARSSALSSWSMFQELQGFKGTGKHGDEETVTYDIKEHHRVQAAYDASVQTLKQEVEKWEQALTEAIENLVRYN